MAYISLAPTKKRKPATGNKGFNLVEAAIVLGVVGLVIGGIWTAANSVQNNMKITESTKLIGLLYQNARSLYVGQRLTHHAINGPLLRSITPADYRITGAAQEIIIGPFGEQIGVTVTGLGTLSIYMDSTTQYCNIMAPRFMAFFKNDFAQGTTLMSGDGSNIASISDTEGACETIGGLGMELNFP